MLRLVMGIISLACSFYDSTGQTRIRSYAIKIAGFNIGDLVVTTYEKDSLTYFTLSSKVSFWILFKVNVEHTVISVYQKDLLISSLVTTHSNKGDFKSSTVWDKDHYVVNVNGYNYKKDTLIYTPINYSILKLYFEKPENNQPVLADNYGLIAPAEYLKTNDALVVSVLGNNNTYYYRDRSLVKVMMYSPIKDYQIKFKSEVVQ